MEIAGGHLGWSEERFWSSSPQYFFAALDGYMERICAGKADMGEDEFRAEMDRLAPALAMTDEDLARLRAERQTRERESANGRKLDQEHASHAPTAPHR